MSYLGLKPGDEVIYTRTFCGKTIHFKAIVINISPNNIRLKHGPEYQQIWGSPIGSYPEYYWDRITRVAPLLSKEERVKLKITSLWNNSNWVKLNPNQAITT